MADDIIINVGSDDEANNINVGVSGDKYYTDLARSWASSDSLVANTDYSSKYYANISKNAAYNCSTIQTTVINLSEIVAEKADAAALSAQSAQESAEYIVNNAPTLTVTQTSAGAILTAVDMTHGETYATILNGINGSDGVDGFSPITNITQTQTGAVITITDSIGTTTATLLNGAKGDKGDKGEQGIQGIQGVKGDTGTGVTGVTLLLTVGKVKTYRMNFSDNTHFDYEVTDGSDGGVTIDQTFDPTSENPQSGIAINGAMQHIVTGYPVYSASEIYAVGDRVRYSSYVWECTTAITEAEAWNADHWTALDPIQTQIDDKVDKVTGTYKIYGTDGNGGQTSYTLSSGVTSSSSIPLRNANGQISVAETPTADGHASSKKYVDTGLSGKQATLVSGTSIKTINNTSLLGSGNIDTKPTYNSTHERLVF